MKKNLILLMLLFFVQINSKITYKHLSLVEISKIINQSVLFHETRYKEEQQDPRTLKCKPIELSNEKFELLIKKILKLYNRIFLVITNTHLGCNSICCIIDDWDDIHTIFDCYNLRSYHINWFYKPTCCDKLLETCAIL